MRNLFLFGAIAAVFLTSGVWAGEPELGVKIDRQSILLGDAVRLTVTVRNDLNPEKPEVGEVPGFDLRYRGVRQESFSSVTVVVQGKTVEQRQSGGGFYYDFDLIPKAAGTFDIAPIPVSYKDRLFSTERFKIEVFEESQKSEDVFVELTVDKPQIYLGESATVTFKWFFNKNVNQYEIRMPWLDAPEGFVVTDPPQDPARRYQKLLVNGSQEVLAAKTMEAHRGREYAVVSFSKILTPHRAGSLDLDAAFVKGNAVTGYEGTGRSSFFDDFFGSDFNAFFAPMQGRAVTESFAARSEKLHLTVREVPRDGAPADFTGAVGRFRWKVGVTPDRLAVGEPLTLKIEVSGDGNIEEAVIPVPGDLEGFKGYEPESKFVPDPNHPGSGIRLIEKVWVARKSGAQTIPPIRWSYYNSAESRFETLSAGPFAVLVEPAQDGLSPAENPSPASVATSVEPTVLSPPAPARVISRDIRYLRSDPGSLKVRQSQTDRRGWMGWVVFLPLIGIVMAGGISEWRRIRSSGAASRRAGARKGAGAFLAEAKAGLAQNDPKQFYAAGEKALGKYLAERWGLPVGMPVVEMLGRVPESDLAGPDRAVISEFVERAERVQFGSLPVDAPTMQKDLECIRRVLTKWGIGS